MHFKADKDGKIFLFLTSTHDKLNIDTDQSEIKIILLKKSKNSVELK
jgi:hypothetical protein